MEESERNLDHQNISLGKSHSSLFKNQQKPRIQTKITDEPIAPVSGKESAYKLEASVSYGLSAEDIPSLSVLSIESSFLSPK